MKKKNRVCLLYLFFISFFVLFFVIFVSYRNYSADHKVFGVTFMTMNNPFYEIIDNELREVIESKGDDLITLDSTLSVEKQKEQIQKLIDQKVDGIFINPVDSKLIEQSIQECKKANIPVVILDAPTHDSDLVDCTVVSDNYGAGVQCAKDMMKRLDKAKIVLVKHSKAYSAKLRIDGFVDTIANYPEYEVVAQGECEGQLELAMPLMNDILNKGIEFDVVMALNDPSALGVLASLSFNNKKDVLVYGIDGTPDLKQLIGQNSMVAGTVAQSPISIGRLSVNNMYDILEGKKVDKEVIVPVELITETNLKDHNVEGWQ